MLYFSDSHRKRKTAFTPLETRKQIISHTNKKNELLSFKEAREHILLKYAKEEHDLNLNLKKEAHEKAMRHQDEIHEMEVKYRTNMYSLMLEKCKYECEKAKLEINKMSE